IDLGDEIFNNYQLVLIDKKLLRQIITNLLTNAIKYSPDHNLVNFSLSREDHQLIFKISDYGIGIPATDQVHLFEYFQRGSNVGTLPGTGLGLSIVKKCVDLHEGEITFHSELGKGTVFTVILPFLKG
ncbi:sensor histidine kinase, partial [Dolichospermum circinale]